MCLGIPGKLLEKFEKDGQPIGKVEFGGISKEIGLSFVPEAEVGQYVLVHVGFALNVIDEEEAKQIFEYIDELEEGAKLERQEIDADRVAQSGEDAT